MSSALNKILQKLSNFVVTVSVPNVFTTVSAEFPAGVRNRMRTRTETLKVDVNQRVLCVALPLPLGAKWR